MVYYNSKAYWECVNSECHHKSIDLQGEKVRWNEDSKVQKISENESIITTTTRVMKLHKGCVALCRVCKERLTFLGWHVWVEDSREEKTIAAIKDFNFRTGTKIKDTKYCKTLKSRRKTIDGLLKKYSKK